jgi:hypothetical protein
MDSEEIKFHPSMIWWFIVFALIPAVPLILMVVAVANDVYWAAFVCLILFLVVVRIYRKFYVHEKKSMNL